MTKAIEGTGLSDFFSPVQHVLKSEALAAKARRRRAMTCPSAEREG
jgi:hypothetical protein